MSADASTRLPRGAPHRSLPTITIFSHAAARLVKTVPQLQPPTRVNGHVPSDTLGIGRTSPSDVILTDVYGPLSILVVPDPLDPTIATLVLSVGFQDAALQGAARRFVLPFRSFQRDPNSGDVISQSHINTFDAAHRQLYPGLGAGSKGLDGGSFWFFEDVGEEGAFERYRWEKDGVGRRAIWTVWLISTPAPVVLHVQNLLRSYPAPVPPLPPWLKQSNGYPWKDNFIAIPQVASQDTFIHDKTPTILDSLPAQPSASSTPPLPLKSLPSIPRVPAKPDYLRGDKQNSSEPAPSLTTHMQDTVDPPAQIIGAANVPSDGHEASITSPSDSLEPHVARSETVRATSQLRVRSRHLPDGSSSVTIGDAPQVILRDTGRAATVPEYRNSLVAVDNITGQIVGVLASQINLDVSPSDPSQITDAAASIHDAGDDIDDQHEAQTPQDEHVRILHDKVDEHAFILHTEQLLISKQPIVPDDDDDDDDDDDNQEITPRPSTFVHRTVSIYHDTAADRAKSRPPSILAHDTFAPPPLPPKQSPLHGTRLAARSPADAPTSHRISTHSAAFFSAESDAEAMSSYDSDALEIDAPTSHHNLPASFISIRGERANDVERHRPELLRDFDTDQDAESDASGSTVGGPAVRMWRKARGKTKRNTPKPASAASPVAQPRHVRKSRQPSELSDCTSKAETCLEEFSDIDSADDADDADDAGRDTETPLDSVQAAQDADAVREEDHPPCLSKSKTGPGYHLPRAALRTDEVRSIEDRVWREALDEGQLPIDAPYTHLAARGDAGLYPSSILSSPPWIADGSAIELLSAEDKIREAQQKKKQQQLNQRAERIRNMQGGTVLIEFLAGSSRIGASLIRGARLDTSSRDADVAAPDASSKPSDLASNMLGYVPLLPQHLLSFLGLWSSTTSPAKAENTAELSTATSPISYLPSLRLPAFGGLLSDASDWVTSLFTFSPAVSTPASRTPDADAPYDPSDADEYEYVIPEFDPLSLASTPRPIYRRKRPVLSAANGFNISAAAPSSGTAQDNISKDEVRVPQTPSGTQLATANEHRYSILHIDGLGIGRRAFFRGMPELEGMHF